MGLVVLQNNTNGKKFVFRIAETISDSKDFNIIKIPLPSNSENGQKVMNIMAPSREISVGFTLTSRSDDYTGGTGTPTTYEPDEQRKWLMSSVAVGQSAFTLTDEMGNSYDGILERIRVDKSSDSPLAYKGNLTFFVGDEIL